MSASPPTKWGVLLPFKRKEKPPASPLSTSDGREPDWSLDTELAWEWTEEEKKRGISVRHEAGGRRVYAAVLDPDGAIVRLVLTPELARQMANDLTRSAHFAAQSADFAWRMTATRALERSGEDANGRRICLMRCELGSKTWWEVERPGRRTFAIVDRKKAERIYREATDTGIRRCGAWPGMDFLEGYSPNRHKGCIRRRAHTGKHKSKTQEWE